MHNGYVVAAVFTLLIGMGFGNIGSGNFYFGIEDRFFGGGVGNGSVKASETIGSAMHNVMQYMLGEETQTTSGIARKIIADVKNIFN